MKRGITLIALALLTLGITSMEARAQGPREVEIVRNWYQRYLGREPDNVGLMTWSQELCSRPAADVLASILASPEYYQRHGCTPEGFITGLYLEVLGRQPNGDEVNSWLWQLARCRGDRRHIAQSFLAAAGNELATRPIPFAVPQAPAREALPQPPQGVGYGVHYLRR